MYFIIVSIPYSGTVWNTNDDRYSDFGHFLHFLILSIFENMETYVFRNDLGGGGGACFGA